MMNRHQRRCLVKKKNKEKKKERKKERKKGEKTKEYKEYKEGLIILHTSLIKFFFLGPY